MWGHLHRCFTAAPNAPGAARRCISEWLQRLGWAGPDRDDVVLAVSEAITNAVEHAYPAGCPGPVTVEAATLSGPDGTQRLHITVADEGIWRGSRTRPAPAETVPPRGTGLAMIQAAMAHTKLDANATGTRLTMTTRPAVPATSVVPPTT